MKSRLKRPAARNPFVALALKRRAGAHRKPNKAVRRSEKVSLKINGDVARRSSSRLLTDRQGFDSLHPHQNIAGSVPNSGRCRECFARIHSAPLAQLVEHPPCKRKVVCSRRTGGTTSSCWL